MLNSEAESVEFTETKYSCDDAVGLQTVCSEADIRNSNTGLHACNESLSNHHTSLSNLSPGQK